MRKSSKAKRTPAKLVDFT